MTTYILYYEHKALCMCDCETLHTHVVQHYHCHITNSNQPQAMTTYSTVAINAFTYKLLLVMGMLMKLCTHG